MLARRYGTLKTLNMEHQYCPICNAEVRVNHRYPYSVCSDCARTPLDDTGRELEYFNESLSERFEARYTDNGERRNSHICFIAGMKCFADEARFGGIVIQPCAEEYGKPL